VKPPRLAMIASRFWPRVGSLETRAGLLACGLADRGAEITIVTARWHPHWPAEILYHGMTVVRLSPPPTGSWSAWRWGRAIRNWIARRADCYDLVLAWGLTHEARAAIQAARQAAPRLPVVLVPERTGWHGDCFRQVRVSGGRGMKSECLRADAFVAGSPAARRDLEAAGYPRERIFDVHQGVSVLPPRTFETQMEARAALADANSALQLAMQPGLQTPLAVSTTRLDAGRGWENLLAAWSIVARQKSEARLWMAGELSAAGVIAERIDALGLNGRACLIGLFDDIEGLMSAADVHAAPCDEAAPMAILEAMAAGAPSVAIDTPVNRWLLGDEAAGLLVPADDPGTLAAAILRLIDDAELAARLGETGWKRAAADFSVETMVDGYLALFERLRGKTER
jgi:glycosyltransferase involved in cell wall biosynthesis